MAHITSHRHRPHEEEESYFISMSDMMVGLLFIFIIMLVYFAMQYQQTTTELTGANTTRSQILAELKQRLEAQHIRVEVDDKTGVLRLPEDVLFDKSQYELNAGGVHAVSIVAKEMMNVLPCYTFGVARLDCGHTAHHIDAIFIEGHTDKDPMHGGMDNWDLSVRRATNTYRQLIAAAPDLVLLKNYPQGDSENSPAPILGVSGYGPDRPIVLGDNEESKRLNRRIDLRFLMTTPTADHSLNNILLDAK